MVQESRYQSLIIYASLTNYFITLYFFFKFMLKKKKNIKLQEYDTKNIFN